MWFHCCGLFVVLFPPPSQEKPLSFLEKAHFPLQASGEPPFPRGIRCLNDSLIDTLIP